MARKAIILYVSTDHYGDRWDAREERPTEHDWPLLFGWPHGFPRGRAGCGAPRLILTTPLYEYFDSRRLIRGGVKDLPIGRNTAKKLWRMIGRDYAAEIQNWWEDRAADLAALTLQQFALQHGTTQTAAEMWRLRLFGRKLRAEGWWREPPARDLLVSAMPRAYVADVLGISVGAVGRLRWMLKHDITAGNA